MLPSREELAGAAAVAEVGGEKPATERAIIFFTCVAHALTHVYMLIWPSVIAPMGEEFKLSRADFTFYATISQALFGLGALPAGWLGDKIGEKSMLVLFFLLTAVGGLVLGLAGGIAGLAAGMTLVGAGCSIFHPVGNALISKCIREPGRAMGINGLWGSLGTAAGPIYAGALTAETGNWRWTYLALGPPMALLGLWLLKTPIRTLPEAPGAAHPTLPRRPGAPETRWRLIVIGLLLGAMTCGGLYFTLVTSMLPTHAGARVQLGGLSPLEVGSYVSSFVYLVGGAGQVLAGNLVHAREGRGLYVAMLAIALPLVLLTGALEGLSLIAVGSAMAIFVFAVQPIENVLLSRFSPPGRRGFLFGLKFVLAFGVGSSLGSLGAGRIDQHFGVSAVFTAAAAITGLSLLAAIGAWACRKPPGRQGP